MIRKKVRRREKNGIFSRIFKIGEKDQEKTTEKDKRSIFNKYREIIDEYKYYCDNAIYTEEDENGELIEFDRITVLRIINDIKWITSCKKQGMEIYEEDEVFLKEAKPYEFWKECARYYSITKLITEIVQDFDKKIDYYQQLYKENPSLFDVKNLERIFEENGQTIIDIKNKRKEVKRGEKDLAQKRDEAQTTKVQIQELEKKKRELEEKTRKIARAQTLKELGYKDKKDACRKLSIESKDYIVVEIPNGITDVSELFNNQQQLKIEIDGRTFIETYSNDVISGRINSIQSSDDSNAAIMIPIDTLKKEDIDSIKANKIMIKLSAIQNAKILAIVKKGRELNFGNLQVEISRFSKGKISKEVKAFLGDDYASDSDEIKNYEIFKNIPTVSSETKKRKREAITDCLFKNVGRDILHTDEILVNGKRYFFNQEDEKENHLRKRIEPLDEIKLEQIADKIETYLIEDRQPSVKIDEFYQELLLEYMRVNKKARADYYEENDTTITLNNKNMSIKPVLPAEDELVAKRYSRGSENIAYKMMKLASLANKFAHMTENKELQSTLYQAKSDLIERAIELSYDNPNINIKKQFDEERMATSVIIEIPGYNMIALHLLDKSEGLLRKVNQLEEYNGDIINTSTIITSNINRDVLTELQKMSIEERAKAILNMNANTFYKFIIRMGYNPQMVSSQKDRENFIKQMLSDDKISKLLKESEEVER